jgi:aminopeptidase N
MILAADKLNPQTAAKLVPPLGRWRRFTSARRADAGRARADRRHPGVSKDVFEQASKSLV